VSVRWGKGTNTQSTTQRVVDTRKFVHEVKSHLRGEKVGKCKSLVKMYVAADSIMSRKATALPSSGGKALH